MIEQVFGPYRIVDKIGAGGMGEVYRARDTNLERDVAIKVLPEVWAGDPERLARFRREAQVLASLNHPHIAHVYGVERGGANAGPAAATGLVMELVEGPTLADRIGDGPLAMDEAIAIARQIVDALDAAHEHGIVHRDLKPANVKVRDDGTVKILDFGLAKMTTPAVAGSASAAMSPTLTSPAMSQIGTILGTAAYMSPEQARGKIVDKRTDIWAFGCVLFEMLSGRRPFDGEDVTEILASVVKSEPAWKLLPASVPPRLVRLIKRCLEKNPRQRLRDIGDAQFELALDTESAPVSAAPSRHAWRERAVWIGALALVAAVGAAGWMLRRATTAPALVTRFSIVIPEGQRLNAAARRIAVSRDGSMIVYSANNQLYRRALNASEPQAIAGSNESPTFPEFSPDGRSIVYGTFDATSRSFVLKSIPVTGGTAVAVATLSPIRDAGGWLPAEASMSWDGEQIVGSKPGGIWAVPAGGGAERTLVTVDPAVEVATGPRLINGGRHLLYSVRRVNQTGPEAVNIVVQPVDGGSRKVLVTAGRNAYPLPTGHLVYLRGSDLMAVRFDESRQAISGDPVVVARDVPLPIAMSPAGTLVYLESRGVASRTAVWLDRRGSEEPIPMPPQQISLLRLSPDGSRLTVSSGDEIRVWSIAKQTMTRLREEEGGQWDAAWMPDGNRLLFSAGRTLGSNRILMKAADGSGTATTVVSTEGGGFPNDVSTDGKFLMYHKGVGELMLHTLDGSAPPRQIVKGAALNAVFSPNGKWIAYQAIENSRSEVFVRAFPDLDAGRWQVSTTGGRYPVWSPDGHEIFFISVAGHFTVVKVDSEKGFATGAPVELFRTDAYDTNSNSRPYDIAPDGKRFVFPKLANEGRPAFNVVTNWLQEVTAKVDAQPRQ